ncbi:MAG: YqgE/AlgH family protein [Pseudomonadota bacterium]
MSSKKGKEAEKEASTMAMESSLAGQFLIAMPNMGDPRFAKTVIYLCAHDDEGAMGLVINKTLDSLRFPDILAQLNIESTIHVQHVPVYAGGPVESGRGFLLHSSEYEVDSTIQVDGRIALTATTDALQALAENQGPQHSLFALGYAGWGAGQLDMEIQDNGWLTAPATPDLVFDPQNETIWDRAVALLGFDPTFLSGDAGRA